MFHSAVKPCEYGDLGGGKWGGGEVSVLTGCPYEAAWIYRKCKGFLSPGTKQTIRDNEVSVKRGSTK